MRYFFSLKNFPRWHQVLVEVRTQVLICYIGLMALLTGISIPIIYQVVFQQIDRRLQTEVASEIEELQSELNVENPQNLLQLKLFLFEYLNDELVEEDQFLIILFDRHIFQSSPPIEELPKSFQPNSAFINQLTLIDRADPKKSVIQDAEMGKIIYGLLPLQLQGKNQGFFLVAHATSEEHQEVASAMQFVIGITSVLFLLTSMVAWVISGLVLRPLRVMSATARQISAKDLSQRLPVGGKGEMAEIAETFNEMMDRLQKAFLS